MYIYYVYINKLILIYFTSLELNGLIYYELQEITISDMI